MNSFRKRLMEVEERKALRDCIDVQRELEGRSQNELVFFAVHGSFPETLAGELPKRQEFMVAGIRTVITAERVSQ